MVIPEFPEFKVVDMSCGAVVKEFLSKYSLEASEYTFTNIYAYRFESAYNFRLSLLKDNLIIIKGADPVSAFCPIGNSQIPEVMSQVFDYLREHNHAPYFERIPESFIDAHVRGSGFIINEERDHFDYVYDVKELIELKGSRFHVKRNNVNKFRKNYKYEYIPLTPDLIGECLDFEDYWCEVRDCEKHPGLKKEQCAILVMLNNMEALDIIGGAIRVNSRIAAVTLGQRMLDDTMLIHVEKATPDIPGP